jgi:hypothetical protein
MIEEYRKEAEKQKPADKPALEHRKGIEQEEKKKDKNKIADKSPSFLHH